jgi:hypothetical protein
MVSATGSRTHRSIHFGYPRRRCALRDGPYLTVIISAERVWPARAQARIRIPVACRRCARHPIDQYHGKEVSHVYQPPYMASQLVNERHRELMALGEQQHRARKRAALARASRRVERAERRMRRAARKALRLRAELGQ